MDTITVRRVSNGWILASPENECVATSAPELLARVMEWAAANDTSGCYEPPADEPPNEASSTIGVAGHKPGRRVSPRPLESDVDDSITPPAPAYQGEPEERPSSGSTTSNGHAEVPSDAHTIRTAPKLTKSGQPRKPRSTKLQMEAKRLAEAASSASSGQSVLAKRLRRTENA